MNETLRRDAEQIIRKAISSVKPDEAVRRALAEASFPGRVFLVAAGKAAWQMASTAVECLKTPAEDGVVVTKYEHVMSPIQGIRCYEAGLELTVENVRPMSRMHPRCGTSFLLVVMILSILIFSAGSSLLLTMVPNLETLLGDVLYRVAMIGFKLLLLPVVVAFSYEFNRLVGRHDNWFTRILTAPGMWFQRFTTYEPDDSMIEVGIAALQAVIPEQEGEDKW